MMKVASNTLNPPTSQQCTAINYFFVHFLHECHLKKKISWLPSITGARSDPAKGLRIFWWGWWWCWQCLCLYDDGGDDDDDDDGDGDDDNGGDNDGSEYDDEDGDVGDDDYHDNYGGDDDDDKKIEFPGSDHSWPPPVEWRLSRVQQQFDGKTHPMMIMMMAIWKRRMERAGKRAME